MWNDEANAFVARHEKKQEEKGRAVATQENSKITFLHAGDVSKDSTDAITGGQLYSMGGEILKYFGSGAKYENGQWTEPSFKVAQFGANGTKGEEKTYHNVAEAFEGVNSTFTTLNGEIGDVRDSILVKQATEITLSRSLRDGGAGLITIGKGTGGSEISILNKDNGGRKLSGLMGGDLGENSNEAVNGGQIHTLGSSVASYLGGDAAFTEGVFKAPTYNISNVSDDGTVTTKSHNDVGSAFSDLDTSVKNVNTHLTNEVKKFDEKLTNITQEVQGDALLWSKTDKAFVAQHGSGDTKVNSKIKYLANGTIAANSTDAVNGSQLFETNKAVATYLGGGAGYKDGAWTTPNFKVSTVNSDGSAAEEKSYENVADALASVGSSLTNVHKEIKNEINQVVGDSLVKQDADTHVITIGGEKSGTKVTLANTDGAARTLSGIKEAAKNDEAVNKGQLDQEIEDVRSVAVFYDEEVEPKDVNPLIRSARKVNKNSVTFGDPSTGTVALHNVGKGKVAESSTDAINGSQLFETNKNVASYLGGGARYESGKWADPNFKVKQIGSDGNITEESYKNVADAFESVGSSFKSIHDEISTMISDSFVKQDDTGLITIGKEVAGGEINIANKDGGERTLSGVKTAQNDNEAVNKGQLDQSLKDLSNSLQSDASAVVHYDKTGDETDYTSVTLGKGKEAKAVALHNVANGEIAKDSRDAVNGGQINTISGDIAKFLGGGTTFTDGVFTGPTYKLSKVSKDGKEEEAEFENVGIAFEGLDTSIKNVNQRIKEVSQGVAQDSLSWSKDEDAFSAQHGTGDTKANSKITSLANGTISETSTDAVNGSQLFEINKSVATYLGGGAEYKEGQWTAPQFKVKAIKENGDKEDKTYQNVASAFEGIGTSFENVNTAISNVKNEIANVKGDSLVKWDEEQQVVKIGAEKGGNTITISDQDSKDRILSGVKDAERRNEAVNKGQLDDNVTKLSGEIADVRSLAVFYDEEADSDEVNTLSRSLRKVNKNSVTFGDPNTGTVALHNVGNGSISSESHDAVNGSQLYLLGTGVATFLGGEASYENGAWTAPTFKVTTVKDDGKEEEKTYQNVADAFEGVGTSFTNIKKDITNQINHLQSDDSVVVHYDKKDKGEIDYTNVTLGKGKGSTAVGLHNVADGSISKDSHDAVTGGQLDSITNDLSKALGGNVSFDGKSFKQPQYDLSTVSKDGQVDGKTYNDVGTAFSGLDDNIKNVNARIKEVSEGVAKDSLNWSSTEGAFVAQHGTGDTKANSKITSLANGIISETSTDAVNGSQLFDSNKTVATYLGGGAKYADGQWTAPKFTVKTVKEDGSAVEEQSYDDVAKAFASVGTSFTNIHKELKNEISQVVGDSLVKQDKESKVIKIGAEKGGNSINIANSGDAPRTLTGVKSGVVSEESSDAVNGSQLYSMSNTLSSYFGGGAKYEDGKWVAPSFKVKTVKKEGGAVEEESYEDVVSAFAGIGTSFENLHQELKNEINQVVGDSLVKQDDKTHVISVGGEKSGTKVTLANVDNAARTLLGVKSGELSETSTEAVNGSQLFATNQNVSTVSNNLQTAATNIAKSFGGGAKYEEGQWTAPSFMLKAFSADGKEGENKTYNDVGLAFAGIDTNFTNVNKHLTNVVEDFNKKIDDITKEVKGDSLLWSNADGAFSAQHGAETKTNSKIKFLAAGDVTKDSTEAINGSQVYSLSDKFAKYLDVSAGYDAKGEWKDPSFKITTIKKDGEEEEKTYPSVADAFEGVGTSFTNIKKDITNQINHLQSDDSAVVHYDKTDGENSAVDYASITLGGKDKTLTALHNVADGSISKDSHDAVTGGQINTISQDVAKFLGGEASFKDGGLTQPTYKLSDVTKEGQVTDKSFTDVGTAFSGLDANIKNVNERIKEVSEGVAKDSLNWSSTEGAFVAQHETGDTKANSKITSLANGNLAENSTDAVNGSQLFETNKNVSTISNNLETAAMNIAKFLGGGAEYKEGQWTAPNFKVKTIKDNGDTGEGDYASVAAAFEGVGTSFTNIKNELNKEITNVVSDSLVKFEEETNLIKVGGEKDGASINIADKQSKDRILSGVKDAEHSNEAVNKGQLDDNVTKLSGEIADVRSLAVFYDEEADSDEVNTLSRSLRKVNKNSVTFGDPNTGTVALHNVGKGKVAENSADAINGSQLFETNNKFSTYLGGGAGYKDGIWSEPSFTVKTVKDDGKEEEKTYQNVADAFEGVGTSFTNIKKDITNQINHLQSDDSAVVHYDKTDGENSAVDYGSITLGGKDKTHTALHNVADGSISEKSHDAVTGGQIYNIGGDIAKFLGGGASFNNGAFTGPTYQLSQVDTNGKVETTEFKDVGSAFAGIDTNVKNVNNNLTNKFNELTQNITNITQEVQGDALLWNKEEEAFVAQHGDKKSHSRITSLAKGHLSEGSSDAVNGSQLFETNDKVSTYLGGGAEYKEGQWTAPQFKVSTVNSDGSAAEEKSYENVADALASVGSSLTNVHKEIKNEINQVVSDSLVKQNEETHVISIGGEKSGTEVTLANTDGVSRSLSGVKAGTLSATSTEAVNGSQLYSLNETLATYFGGGAQYKDGQWVAPSFKVKAVKKEGGSIEEEKYDDVAAAFAGVGTSFENLHQELKNEIKQVVGDSLVKQDDKTHVISVGGEKSGTKVTLANVDNAARTLLGVKGGELSETSTEAVNGSQLFATNQNVSTVSNNLQTAATNIAKSFGGGASYENGTWTAPSFKVKTIKDDGGSGEEDYASVAEAFAGVGNSFTNIKNELKNEISQVVSDSLVKFDDKSRVIKIGSEKDGTEITFSNSEGMARSLSGVKAGTLSATSTEAVNGSQLYSLNETLATYFGGGASYKDGQWVAPSFKVKTVKKEGGSVEEEKYDDVAAAFAGVGTSFENLHQELKNEINQVVGDSLVKQDDKTHVISVGGEKSGTEVTLANVDGAARTLSGVKAGLLSDGSMEAINGSQLYSMSNTLAGYFGGGAGYKDGGWISPEFKVARFKSDGSSDDDKSYHDVASAFEGINGSMSTINDRIKEVEKDVSSNGLNWNKEIGAYDGKHNGASSKISNVSDGLIEEGSQDVVNGGQLWQTNDRVSKVESKVDSIDQQVKDIATSTDGAVKYDKDKEGHKTNKITLVGGNESDPVLIDNVADGKIEKGSKEAVNGGQLHDYTDQQMKIVLEDAKKYTDEHINDIANNSVSESKAYTDMKFETLNYAIEDVRKEARQAAAIGLAVSNLSYDDTPGKLSFSFGSGLWRSQSAFAIGAGYMSENGRFRSNISATSAGGHWGVGAGFRITLN
nr:Vomp family autotransporter [Bartonella sp. AU15XJBT]